MNSMILTKLQNDIEESVDRYKSILAIPRKEESLLQDLELVFKYVKDTPDMHINQFNEKIVEGFGVSFNTARNVRPILERANLLMKTQDSKIKLTAMAENYFKTEEIGYLSKGFIYNYFGFLEFLYLIQKNGPSRRKDLISEWESLYEKEYGKRITTTNITQFSRIYIYLLGLGLIRLNNRKIELNDEHYLSLEKIEYW
ncbi:hypothetical protein [Halalkalibacter alkaliphilus]|uniref:Uncharacterized protein n=1 Tax=Halalkalibacter alkaliphilus TaxID=2917993 RepID=A0A9X2I8A6_9BACI|nr:hypothetical protein [Halalkalibacter alkaliphilus]MCL7748764.1 hypothetical protein [Halalkalibacter alkaliphilus]